MEKGKRKREDIKKRAMDKRLKRIFGDVDGGGLEWVKYGRRGVGGGYLKRSAE